MAIEIVDGSIDLRVSEASQRKMEEEVMVRRLMALLEEEFGPVEGARPKLRLIKGGLSA